MLSRNTGKSFRAALDALLIASLGNDVELVVYEQGTVAPTLRSLVGMVNAYSDKIVDGKFHSHIVLCNGAVIYVTTLKHRLDPRGHKATEVVKDVV